MGAGEHVQHPFKLWGLIQPEKKSSSKDSAEKLFFYRFPGAGSDHRAPFWPCFLRALYHAVAVFWGLPPGALRASGLNTMRARAMPSPEQRRRRPLSPLTPP